jgi:hypothetical protein
MRSAKKTKTENFLRMVRCNDGVIRALYTDGRRTFFVIDGDRRYEKTNA